MRISLKRHRERPPEPQIGDLKQLLILKQKQILRLQIAVKHAVAVAVRDAFAELEHELLDQGIPERPRVGGFAERIDEFLEVGVEVLEDEVEVGLRGGLEDVLDAEEADDVEGGGEHLEEGDLAERRGRDAFLVDLEARFLERDELSGGFLDGFVDFAVGSFADFL